MNLETVNRAEAMSGRSAPRSSCRVAAPGVALVGALNGPRHRRALQVFLVVVLAHWGEHLLQAYQTYVLGWPTGRALGGLGLCFPWLVKSEWLHYGYNLTVLSGLALLLPGFTGRARTWWRAALAVQGWHYLEHAFLLAQVLLGVNLFGRAVPTSVLQLWVPRLELHQFYNAIVLAPIVVGFFLQRRRWVSSPLAGIELGRRGGRLGAT